MSDAPRDPSDPSVSGRSFVELHESDLDTAAALPWLWHGLLAPGNVTLLTSQWKTGKTTLLAVLLAKMRTGGTLLERELRPGRAAVVSEESANLWRARRRQLTFGDGHVWFCRPFVGRPALEDWLALLDHLAGLHARQPLDLVVIDSLGHFLPGSSENLAASILTALSPLHRLTELGLGVLLLHHPRKRSDAPGMLARGSGALSAFADILLEMRFFDVTASKDRRRRLSGFSRHEETPRELLVELNADRTDYTLPAVADPESSALADQWSPLRLVLEDAAHELTRKQILEQWSDDYPKPSDVFLWRILTRAVEEGRLRCQGVGTRGDPFRYWLPEREAVWREIYGSQMETMDDEFKAALYRTKKWQEKFLGGSE